MLVITIIATVILAIRVLCGWITIAKDLDGFENEPEELFANVRLGALFIIIVLWILYANI